jgi:hypothetical protein
MLALARARSWMRALRQGEYADTAEIARRFGFSNAHVRRLLRFAYLAPDILEAIVDGRQPRSLTVRVLLRSVPLAWSDQRAVFALAQSATKAPKNLASALRRCDPLPKRLGESVR